MADRFADRAAELRRVLGDRARRIEHVGSTAVPGLRAKAVIDILVSVDEPDDEPVYLPDLEAAGYDLPGCANPVVRCLRAGGPDEAANLHIYADTDPEIKQLVLFRDRLGRNAADRAVVAASHRPRKLARDRRLDLRREAAVVDAVLGRRRDDEHADDEGTVRKARRRNRSCISCIRQRGE